MTCKNCGSNFDSKFCPNCGQKADIHPITLRSVIHDFVHAFTHADKGFLLTLKRVLKRPGIVAKEYLEGKRKKYFNPLSFLVITVALSAYLSYESGYFEAFSKQQPRSGPTQLKKQETQSSPAENQPESRKDSLAVSTQSEIKADSSLANKQPEVRSGVTQSKFARIKWEGYKISVKYGKIIGLILITPLIAFFSWIFFRRPKHNYAEHFVLSSYLFGLTSVFRVTVFIPVFVIFHWNIYLIDMVFQFVFLVYVIIAFRQFFNQNIFWTILKGILVVALFIVSYWPMIWAYVYVRDLITSLLV